MTTFHNCNVPERLPLALRYRAKGSNEEQELHREIGPLVCRKRAQVEDFTFGRGTARVFDDMLSRSVPLYAEIQRMITEIAADFAVDKT